MVAYVFDDILLKGVRAGQVPAREKVARDWYRKKAKQTRVKDTQIMRTPDTSRLKNKSAMGRMQFFYYDPKHKKTLPYYDRFPLIFPIDKAKGGFLGLNFHYLPYRQRAALMDKLYPLVNNEKYDETTRIKASYSILKGAAKYRWFKPAIKHYLSKHVRSRFLTVEASEWDIALFLKVAAWEKKSQSEVFKDSRAIMQR
jgi:hypothetical protein